MNVSRNLADVDWTKFDTMLRAVEEEIEARERMTRLSSRRCRKDTSKSHSQVRPQRWHYCLVPTHHAVIVNNLIPPPIARLSQSWMPGSI